MRRSTLILLVVLLVGLVSAMPAQATTTYHWVSTTGGYVNVASNWSDGTNPGVPTTDDTAIIDNGDTALIDAGQDFGTGTMIRQIVVGDSTGNGNVTQYGGDVSSAWAVIVGRAADLSTYDLQGGSLDSTNSYSIIGDGGGKGKLVMSGTSTFNTNARLYVGFGGSTAEATLDMSGDSVATLGTAVLFGAKGEVIMSGNANLSTPGTGTDWSDIGGGAGTTGTWTMSGSATASLGSPNAGIAIGTGTGASGLITMSEHSTMTMNCWAQVGGAGGVGTINLSGGTSLTDLGPTLTMAKGVNFGIYDNGVGNLNVHDYSEFIVSNGYTLVLGDTSGVAGQGNMLVDGHGKVTVNYLSLGQFNAGDGNAELKDNATLHVLNNAYIGQIRGDGNLTLTTPAVGDHVTVEVDGSMYVGYNGNTDKLSQGVLNVNTGTSLNVGSNLRFGQNYGHGVLNMNGGSITCGYWFSLCAQGGSFSTAEVYMNGDSTVTAGGAVLIGNALSYSDCLAQAWVEDESVMSSDGVVAVAWGGTGVLNVGDDTANDENNAVVHATTYFLLGNGNTSDATLNLNGGGTVETPYITTGFTPVSSVINFNGGILKALANDTLEVPFLSNSSGALTFELNVMAGGANVDTNNHSATIALALLGDGVTADGGLTKLGLGTLTLDGGANTYNGDTVVKAGILSTTSENMLSDMGSLYIEDGASMYLDFSGSPDVIGAIYLGGSTTPGAAGTYGAVGSGADFESGYFVWDGGNGTGMVRVVPEPSVLILLMGLLAMVAGCRIRR